MKLSPHFDSSEFGRPRSPAPKLWLRWAQPLCVDYLEPLRAEFGPVFVISGYRTDAHNAAVGGAPFSYHRHISGRRGAAADVACKTGTPREWHQLLDQLRIPGLGLYDRHVHADNRSGHARW